MDRKSAVFHVRLRAARKQKKFSLERLGVAVGAHRTTIARWERPGSDLPSPIVIFELADFLEVGVRWLLGLTEDQGRPVYLTLDERILIQEYRHLPPHGREVLIETARYTISALKKASSP